MALSPPAAPAQSRDPVAELWLDYNPTATVSPRIDLYGDVGYRVQLESGGFQRLVVRPNARYRFSERVSVEGGLGSFYTWNEGVANLWELRPWLGASAVWPRLPFELQHVARLEGRFEYETREWGTQASVRLRYRLRASHRWGGKADQGRFWRLLGSVELFRSLGEEEGVANELMRLVAGVERGLGTAWRSRLEMTFQKSGSLFTEGTFNQVIVRLRAFHGWAR
jgi:hypothetical protein